MKLSSVWESAVAASNWLLERQAAEGGWTILDKQEVDAHYKTAWSFFNMGHPDAAMRNLNLIQENMLQEDGDFAPRLDPLHKEVHRMYANAYIIIGAMAAGRYEIAYPAGRFLLTQQDQQHGGFYSMLTKKGQKNRCDTMSAGAAGLACLAIGETEAARRAGDFLIHAMQKQPTPDDCFYSFMEADGTFNTNPDEYERWWGIVDTKTDGQCWYALGLPLAFLVRLVQVAPEAKYRQAIDTYFKYQEKCNGAWFGPSSGKVAWAFSMLYQQTGEKKYRDLALQTVTYIISLQEPEGCWNLTAAADDNPKVPKNLDIDATAEFALWFSMIAANIASRESTKL